MAVWSYTPQDLLTETIGVDTHVTQVSPASAVTGRHTDATIRGYRVRYSVRDATEIGSMLAFLDTHQGPFRAFDFWHPLEQRAIRVRFESGITAELFLPGLARTAEIAFVTVVGS
jgi:phage-related protein